MQCDLADARSSPLIHVPACWGLPCTHSLSPHHAQRVQAGCPLGKVPLVSFPHPAMAKV